MGPIELDLSWLPLMLLRQRGTVLVSGFAVIAWVASHLQWMH